VSAIGRCEALTHRITQPEGCIVNASYDFGAGLGRLAMN
jgi:hypothetical protein